MSQRPWGAGDVAALIANPIYAINIHRSFSRPHRRIMTEEQWLAANVEAISGTGSEAWLKRFLLELKVDHAPQEEREARPRIADPYHAIVVHPTLCLDHPPLIDEATWIAANVIALDEDPASAMANLLSVLKGAYAT